MPYRTAAVWWLRLFTQVAANASGVYPATATRLDRSSMSCCGRFQVCSSSWYNLCACAVNNSYAPKCNKKPLDFGFVDRLRAIEASVEGAGNRWRFQRLLHSAIYFQLVSSTANNHLQSSTIIYSQQSSRPAKHVTPTLCGS